MATRDELARRLDTKTATVGVIGLGYVGLPLASALHTGGYRVVGFDIDPAKIESLDAGRNYLKHLGDEMTGALAASERFEATTAFDRLGEPDVVIVCLPTPLGAHREPDLSYVVDAGRRIGAKLRRGQLIVLESTTYPGTTRDEFLPAMLEAAADAGRESLECGVDFFIAYSPEREDPGRKSHSTRTIPKLVGGLDETATELAVRLYRHAVTEVVPVRTAEVAEAAKLLENIFRAVNIAMANEMKMILDGMGVDIWEVIDAASTKPFGFMPFYPGPGLGGHCIPIDPFYLTWKAMEIGRPTRFIELAGEINTAMPEYVIARVVEGLNGDGRSLSGSRILVLGLAYKPNVDDTRESPSFELIARLRAAGAVVDYSDPHVPQTRPVRKHDLQMTSVELTPASIASYDAVLIATNHDAFDYAALAEHARLVIDTRGAMRAYAAAMNGRLIKA
ncbi:MAG: nucleotide sugar dehydrogenase [Phycisphaerales bacterium]